MGASPSPGARHARPVPVRPWRARVALVAAAGAAVVLAPLTSAGAFSSDGPGGVVPEPSASTASTASLDRTVLPKAKKSQQFRSSVPRAEWVASDKAKAVVRRESGGSCRAVSPGGEYRGKWQMGSWFWGNYGGKKFAPRPDRATCAEQDKVAYRGWVDSWWWPWGG